MIDASERDFKAVFIPADVSLGIETIDIHQAKEKALQCFIDHCKIHFSRTSLTTNQLKQLTSDLKQKTKSKGLKGKNKLGETNKPNIDLLEKIALTTTCDMIVLQPNKKETEYISINMYVDDKGVAKQLGE